MLDHNVHTCMFSYKRAWICENCGGHLGAAMTWLSTVICLIQVWWNSLLLHLTLVGNYTWTTMTCAPAKTNISEKLGGPPGSQEIPDLENHHLKVSQPLVFRVFLFKVHLWDMPPESPPPRMMPQEGLVRFVILVLSLLPGRGGGMVLYQCTVSTWWLNQPIWKILRSQNGNPPQIGVKIKKYWKPPPRYALPCLFFMVKNNVAENGWSCDFLGNAFKGTS